MRGCCFLILMKGRKIQLQLKFRVRCEHEKRHGIPCLFGKYTVYTEELLAVFERIHVDELAAAEAGFFGCERHEVAFEGVL